MEKKTDEFTILDGAMGTMLQKGMLKLGERPEILNITHPELIEKIHDAYISAGSEIIYTNTFGANSYKLKDSGYTVEDVVQAAVKIAKAASGADVKVALDIGPIGEMMEPSGSLSFESAYEIFKEIVVAGAAAGADLVAIETMTDLYEVKAAILAVKENSDLPVFVTMSFEKDGRTFTGVTPESFALTTQRLGVSALGVNCSLGPVELYPIVERLSKLSTVPLIVKANAGLPDPKTGRYNMTAEDFGVHMAKLASIGVKYLGGCCGSSPEFISCLCSSLLGQGYTAPKVSEHPAVCTPTVYLQIDDIEVVGERINPTGKKRIQHALTEGNYDFILEEAIRQTEEGASILDVNVGHPGIDESVMMPEIIKRIQSVIDCPLQLDSSKPEALESGLRVYNGSPIVNSVNGTEKSMSEILPLVKKYGASAIVLTLDERGIPKTVDERIEIALKVIDRAKTYGIAKERLFIDCLTLTVSAEQSAASDTLRAMRRLKKELGAVLTLGVSNISFGLPNRDLINRTFLTMALENGLDLPIINSGSSEMMDVVRSFRVLSGRDVDSEDYVSFYSDFKSVSPSQVQKKAELNLGDAVAKGLKNEVRYQIEQLLQNTDELSIINEHLIPALDEVGKAYESGRIFLPSLIKSANAAQEGFALIKESIVKKGGHNISKGKIILATVKGDIHDIGKNIVKVILENYGYKILDLGRDVSPDTVVKVAIEEDVNLVGLSALMTTTLVSMEETIAALRNSGHSCKIMVGGAVLTPEYAESIDADYYCLDAGSSVAVAREVLG